MKTNTMLKSVLVGMILAWLIGIGSGIMWAVTYYERHIPAPQTPVEQTSAIDDPNYVQSIGEAQRRLKKQGFYKGRIDYKWGPQTEKAYCNWKATQAFKEFEK